MNFEINNVLEAAKNNIKTLEKFKTVQVVLGNETCDLDSAISSLVYSLFLHHKKTHNSIIIPVFNIPREELPVKTEVTYFLKRHKINLHNTVCRDDIDLMELHNKGSLQLTLVDHHVLPKGDRELAAHVVSVMDHRPHDPAWPWPQADLTLRTVGSCCTLVAEKLLNEASHLVSPSVANLLLGTILLDTSCLSPAVGKATPLDLQMADQLEARSDKPVNRNQLFLELQTAKSDISSLTSAQLLIKDTKVAAGIPIVGLPMKVKKYLEREDASIAVKAFCSQYKTQVCVLYGMEATSTTVTRDIAVYTPTNSEAAQSVVAALEKSTEPNLQLQSLPCSIQGFKLFDQPNIKVTRKQVLPLVRQVGEKF